MVQSGVQEEENESLEAARSAARSAAEREKKARKKERQREKKAAEQAKKEAEDEERRQQEAVRKAEVSNELPREPVPHIGASGARDAHRSWQGLLQSRDVMAGGSVVTAWHGF